MTWHWLSGSPSCALLLIINKLGYSITEFDQQQMIQPKLIIEDRSSVQKECRVDQREHFINVIRKCQRPLNKTWIRFTCLVLDHRR